MSEDENIEIIEIIKIVIIGESSVGKTSIISQFVDNIFQEELISTVGGLFNQKTMKCVDLNKIIKLEIWDTAGQERYRSVTKMFYKDADVAVLVYDITNQKSFKALQNYWVEQVQESSLKETILVLAANKSDLTENEQVDESEARDYSKEINAIFFVVSAKNSSSINDLFKEIVKKKTGSKNVIIIEDNEDSVFQFKKIRKESISLNKAKAKKKKIGCC